MNEMMERLQTTIPSTYIWVASSILFIEGTAGGERGEEIRRYFSSMVRA
jgi:hypothetical protein